MKNKIISIFLMSTFLMLPAFAQDDAGFDDFAGSDVENEVPADNSDTQVIPTTAAPINSNNEIMSNEEAGAAVTAEEVVPVEDLPPPPVSNVVADEDDEEIQFEEEDTEEIEVVTSERLYLPYKERRNKHGWSFALQVEQLQLLNYQSLTTSAAGTTKPLTYQQIYGTEAVQMPVLRIGYKYNMSFGSILLEGAYGTFNISDNLSGAWHELAITKKSAGATFVADMLFSEPWLAPYFGTNLYMLDISESRLSSPTDSGASDSMTTGFGQQYTAGILIQLNGADPESARTALRTYGLENSYLDIFMTKYNLTADANDPDTSTDFSLGAGLRFEF